MALLRIAAIRPNVDMPGGATSGRGGTSGAARRGVSRTSAMLMIQPLQACPIGRRIIANYGPPSRFGNLPFTTVGYAPFLPPSTSEKVYRGGAGLAVLARCRQADGKRGTWGRWGRFRASTCAAQRAWRLSLPPV